MDVIALTKYSRMSASKARPLARKLQGLPVSEALALTQFSSQKAATYLGKTLRSAVANAQNNADLAVEGLWVKEAIVNDGPQLKRFWPRARGSASPILKRLCHIRIVVSDERQGTAQRA
jgi:large subunit ribosomal protein L22